MRDLQSSLQQQNKQIAEVRTITEEWSNNKLEYRKSEYLIS